MFDSVFARCPNCSSAVEFQSKAGECILGRYSVIDAPPAIACDIDGQTESCASCGYVVTAKLVQNPHLVFV